MAYLAFVMMIITLPAGAHHYIKHGEMNWFLGLGVYFLVYLVVTRIDKRRSKVV